MIPGHIFHISKLQITRLQTSKKNLQRNDTRKSDLVADNVGDEIFNSSNVNVKQQYWKQKQKRKKKKKHHQPRSVKGEDKAG